MNFSKKKIDSEERNFSSKDLGIILSVMNILLSNVMNNQLH